MIIGFPPELVFAICGGIPLLMLVILIRLFAWGTSEEVQASFTSDPPKPAGGFEVKPTTGEVPVTEKKDENHG